MDYGSLEQLFGEAVTTSATGSPQRATEVPAEMTIVTAEEIRRSGAKDIPGVLQHVAGIDVAQWANDNADVSVRGYNQSYSSRLLVLIDGRQVYADFYGFTPWTTLPVELSAIRQIEIVKGPNCALFGFNAVGGVINIITYNPLYDDINTGSATMGTQGLRQGSAVATFKVGDDAAFRVAAGGNTSQDFSTFVPPSMAMVPRGDDDRAAADLYGFVQLNSRLELGLDASHTVSQLNEMDAGYSFDYVRYVSDSLNVKLLADTGIGLVKFNAYADWLAADYRLAYPFDEADFRSEVTVLQVEDLLQLDNDDTLRIATEYRNDTVSTAPSGNGIVSYVIYSTSGTWNWKIAPELSVTNAIRVDSFSLGRGGPVPQGYPLSNSDWDRTSVEGSFNSGLVWTTDDTGTFRILASRGVQSPSLAASGAVLLVSPLVNDTGIPSLALTKVMNYEADWDRQLDILDTKIRASIFHQDTYDIISIGGGYLTAPPTVYLTPSDVGNSHADGFEVGASGYLTGGWQWGMGDRIEFVRDAFTPSASNGAGLIDPQHTTPAQLLKANLGWSDSKWELDGYLRYVSKSFGLRPFEAGSTLVPVEGYAGLDGRIGYRLSDRVTIGLSGQNLLSASQLQSSGPAIERTVLGTLSVTL
jgi:iron complex outermembrane receptor protein